MSSIQTLSEALETLPDHRDRRGRQYRLSSILLSVILGFMCGRDSLLGVARFLKSLTRPQREALGFLWFKVPCHATLCVTFHGLDVEQLEAILSRSALQAHTRDAAALHHLAIDGKALRGSVTQPLPKGAAMLACFSQTLGVVGQKPTKGGYDEVTAAIALLKEFPLNGTVITGDAMFADRTLCDTIGQAGGHYLFPLKGNQPSLQRGAAEALKKACATDA